MEHASIELNVRNLFGCLLKREFSVNSDLISEFVIDVHVIYVDKYYNSAGMKASSPCLTPLLSRDGNNKSLFLIKLVEAFLASKASMKRYSCYQSQLYHQASFCVATTENSTRSRRNCLRLWSRVVTLTYDSLTYFAQNFRVANNILIN